MNPVQVHDLHPPAADLHAEVLDGLRRAPKRLQPKLFYDAHGSALFDAITELPEYYLTRTEIAILGACRDEVADLAGPGCVLIEPGGGNSRKVRLLLEALRPSAYLPIDIARDPLWASARQLADDHPGLAVHAVCADFSRPLQLPELPGTARRVAFFPGSSIGNFEPDAAVDLLRRLAALVGPGGALLVGADLQKDEDVLNAAYNDAQGVTAAFNLNLLERLNRELDADFDTGRFRHYAGYNRRAGRIEMHLVSQAAQRIRIDGTHVDFDAGERIHTENSYKYTRDGFIALATRAGLRLERTWSDARQLFAVFFLTC